MALYLCAARLALAQCGSLGFVPEPNVIWGLKDSVAACPAGDSLISLTPPRPARLRISAYYYDLNQCPKVGVPPESIWVMTSIVEGNLKVNDTAQKTYADDSTDVNGLARITLSSFSGCGKVAVNLRVSGVSQGTKHARVRTADTLSDGRTDLGDVSAGLCDLNYNNVHGEGDELSASLAHVDHWHRNALFGTSVRRTNYCGNPPCQGNMGFLGFSQIFWSPSGRWLSITARPPGLECKVFIVPSDPQDGNAIRQVTYSSPADSGDYDPAWSPLGDEITYGRKDNTIYRRGIPGFIADTSIRLVTFHDDGSLDHRGDLTGAISPDGQWVAFARRTVGSGPLELFKIPINGDTTKRVQLTSHATGLDYYPSWSPDGQYVIFERSAGSDTAYSLFRVRADGTGEESFYDHSKGKPYSYEATTPAYSPDGRIVLAGIGPSGTADSVVTHTIDTTLTSKKPIKSPSYADTALAVQGVFPILSPRLSPDGTRLTLGANQVWAVRRNMSLPPRITKVGSQGVVDSTAKITISAARGLPTTVQVLSTDPESDPITCSAYFLQDGMTFNPSNCTLSWTPTVPVNTILYVKFQVATNTWPKESGGSDQIIVAFNVTSSSQPQSAILARTDAAAPPDGPNPTSGRFALTSPTIRGATATMAMFDLSGRRVATVRGPAGSQLVWDGKDRGGSPAAPGIYLYRMVAGRHRQEGKVVVVR